MDINIAQMVGFVSFGLGIFTFFQKDDRKLKISMLIFNFTHMVHYALLGATTAVLGALLSGLRTYFSIKTNSGWLATGFITVGLVLGWILAESPYDMLPIVGTSIGTFALFRLKGIQLRLAFLVGAFCWLANNIYVGSIGGTLLEACLIFANSITIFRLYRTEKRQKLAEQG